MLTTDGATDDIFCGVGLHCGRTRRHTRRLYSPSAEYRLKNNNVKVDGVHLKDPVQEDLRKAPQCAGWAGVPDMQKSDRRFLCQNRSVLQCASGRICNPFRIQCKRTVCTNSAAGMLHPFKIQCSERCARTAQQGCCTAAGMLYPFKIQCMRNGVHEQCSRDAVPFQYTSARLQRGLGDRSN